MDHPSETRKPRSPRPAAALEAAAHGLALILIFAGLGLIAGLI